MGCSPTKGHHVVPAGGGQPDMRWDEEGFDAACNDATIAFVSVGTLRKLHLGGRRIPPRCDAPWDVQSALHFGAPPKHVQLYIVEHKWRTPADPDPDGADLARAVSALDGDGAFDDDLVILDYVSFMNTDLAVRTRTELEERAFQKQIRFMSSGRANLFFRIKTIVLSAPEYFDRIWCAHGFTLSAFAQRIVTLQDPEVFAHMTPEYLVNFDARAPTFVVRHEPDRERISRDRAGLRELMPLARDDAVGFQRVCEAARFCWVRVDYVHSCAKRGGPVPRRQELPPGTYLEGVVPPGVQPFVVTYGWASVQHPSPSGAKIRELSSMLSELRAADADVVFLDWWGLWQSQRTIPAVYAAANGVVGQMLDYKYGKVTLVDVTKTQMKQKIFALYESTRLYAFAGGALPNGQRVLGCKVLVLPRLEDPSGFPEGGKLELARNEWCSPPREELQSEGWGFCKSVPYQNGGWTCAEYAVARKNRTIANAHHSDVRDVEAARNWPDDVVAFAAMMDEAAESPVAFTKRGDRDAVRFNFFKYCYLGV